MQPADGDTGITLPELLGAYSLATDLGLGQPMEHVLRSWRIADLLGEHVGLTDEQRAELYYVAMLSWVGCVADTPEVATWFGDDIAFRADSYDVDFAGLPALAFMLRHVGAGGPALHRLGLATALIATGGKGVQRGLLSHCLSASVLASRLGLSDGGVRRAAAVLRPLGRAGRARRRGRRGHRAAGAAVPSGRHRRGVPPHARRRGRRRRGAGAARHAVRPRAGRRVLRRRAGGARRRRRRARPARHDRRRRRCCRPG